MNEPLHDIVLIERYFDNALSPEENVSLRDRLASDTSFRKLFDREKMLVQTIRYEAAKKNLDYLKDLEQSFGEKKVIPVRRVWYYYAAAACIALIALALWRPWAGENPEALYLAWFEPYPNIEPTLRGEPAGTRRAEAFQAYEQGDYGRASVLFTELLGEKGEPGMLLLLGNANLAQGKTAEAQQNFSRLLSEYEVLETEAKWYLGLSYLKREMCRHRKACLKKLPGPTVSMLRRPAPFSMRWSDRARSS